MLTSSECKNRAINALRGKWGSGAVVTIVYAAVAVIAAYMPGLLLGGSTERAPLASLASLVVSLLLLPLYYGVQVVFLQNARGKGLEVSTIFEGYSHFGRITTTILLECVFVFLWSLLLFVPGIMKFYSYSLVPYLLKDDPQLKNNEALRRSTEMMRGHRMRLFLLDLSMIGWLLLSYITLGIGFLLLTPYWQTARACFYEDLAGNATTGDDWQAAANLNYNPQ